MASLACLFAYFRYNLIYVFFISSFKVLLNVLILEGSYLKVFL
jgi:hypothetical protein